MENLNFLLSTDDSDIISSGSVIVNWNEPIYFQIVNLKFKLFFTEDDCDVDDDDDDKGKKSPRVEKKLDENNNVLCINIFNVKGAVFGNFSKAIDVATIDGRNLSVRLCIRSFNFQEDKEDRIVFYAWYLKK